MKKLILAQLECTNCKIRWTDYPRGPATFCPNRCGSKSIMWLNYQETFGKMSIKQLTDWDKAYGGK